MSSSDSLDSFLVELSSKWPSLESKVQGYLFCQFFVGFLNANEWRYEIAPEDVLDRILTVLPALHIQHQHNFIKTFRLHVPLVPKKEMYCGFRETQVKVLKESVIWLSDEVKDFLGRISFLESEKTGFGFVVRNVEKWSFTDNLIVIPQSQFNIFLDLEELDEWKNRSEKVTFEKLCIGLKAMAETIQKEMQDTFLESVPSGPAFVRFGQHIARKSVNQFEFCISQETWEFLKNIQRSARDAWCFKKLSMVCAADTLGKPRITIHSPLIFYIPNDCVDKPFIFEEIPEHERFSIEDFKEMLRALSDATAKWVAEKSATRTRVFDGFSLE